nr:MAG TPA: hypothetical protein [Caudoviricetes sp.]
MKYMCLTCRQLAGNLPVNKKCPAVLKAHGRAFAVKKIKNHPMERRLL